MQDNDDSNNGIKNNSGVFFYFEDAESMGEKMSRISTIFLHFSEKACIKNTV